MTVTLADAATLQQCLQTNANHSLVLQFKYKAKSKSTAKQT